MSDCGWTLARTDIDTNYPSLAYTENESVSACHWHRNPNRQCDVPARRQRTTDWGLGCISSRPVIWSPTARNSFKLWIPKLESSAIKRLRLHYRAIKIGIIWSHSPEFAKLFPCQALWELPRRFPERRHDLLRPVALLPRAVKNDKSWMVREEHKFVFCNSRTIPVLTGVNTTSLQHGSLKFSVQKECSIISEMKPVFLFLWIQPFDSCFLFCRFTGWQPTRPSNG